MNTLEVKKNLLPLILFCFAVMLFCAQTALSDTTSAPDRGFTPGGSYALSDIETIALQSGNLMLNIPLASLPPGRGGLSAGLSLRYNSKLWDVSTGEQDYPATGTLAGLIPGEDGGWNYGYRYSIKLQESGTGFTPFIVMPDGSQHKLCVLDGSGNPDCAFTTYTNSTFVDYFTMDGTYLKIRVTATGGYDVMGMTWTMSMPDGTQVINKPAGTSVAQRTIDRNGNKVDITENATDSNYSNLRTTYIEDDMGRKIVILYEYDHTSHPNEDKVYFDGFGGEDMFTLVKWRTVNVKKVLKTCQGSCTPLGSYLQNIDHDFKMVERIYLPAPVSAPTQFGSLFYEFDYNDDIVSGSSPQATVGWGEVSKVTLPSDAYTEYEYTTDNQTGASVKAHWLTNNRPTQKESHYDETYDGSTASRTDTWTYSGGTTPTITGPDGGVTTQYFGTVQGFNPGTGDVLLKTVRPDGSITDSYYVANNPIAAGTYDGVANNFVKYEYNTIADSSGSPSKTAIKEYSRDKNGNVTEVKEYDFVAYSSVPRDGNGFVTGLPSGISSSLKRITQTEYYNPVPDSASTTYNDADSYHLNSSSRLRSLPKASEVLNSSSTPQSRSEITYDYTDYSGSNTKGGNPTATKVWDSTKGSYSNPLTSGNWITTSATYDSYGNPTLTTDARGVDTTITYGCIDGNVSCSGTLKDLYPTKVEKASNYSGVKLTSTSTYDFSSGLQLTSTDEDNNDLTNKTEYDKLGRPVKAISAYGDATWESWTETTYHDADRYVVVESDVAAKGDGKKVAIQHYDQLGRVRLSRTLEDATSEDPTDEQDGIKVQTRYKTVSGYTYQIKSNPYRATTSSGASGEDTMGWTRSKAHHLGKHSEVETFSGSALPAPWGSNSSSTGMVQTDIDANATTVTDQAGKLRRSITNALGQLTRVDEPNSSNALGSISSPNQATYYNYNTLGAMIRVQQGSQDRYFMYDSLGRTLRIRQPEQEVNTSLNTSGNPDNNSWTGGFTYDNNGNVLTATDAKGTTITNTYDALNRALTRTYSDGTPTVTNTYGTIAPAIGKLIKVSSSVSETQYSLFDATGRLTESKQVTDGNTYTSKYTYNLSGAIVEEEYPSGRRVQNVLDNNGDLSIVQSKKNASSGYWHYADGFTYNAAGGVTKMQLGNGLWETAQFNTRQQVTQLGLGIVATDTSHWKIDYEFGELQTNGTVDATKNTGNIGKQTLTVPGTNFVQAYKYDPLDRLTEAKETTSSTQNWIQQFGYDRYGNRTSFSQTIGSTTTTSTPSIDAGTNRFSGSQGFTYDANGNITRDADPLNSHVRSFTFNGDNKQTQVTDVTNSNHVVGTYYYDGEGKRVKKVTDTETTIFVYSAGKLVAEYSTNVTPVEDAKVAYTTADHLGSPRIITDQNAQITSRRDFMPFGEEIVPNVGGRTSGLQYGSTDDEVRQKFTGYQKDAETSLDFAEARMYENRFGRFTAVDPLTASGKSANPQSFNRYIYVGNSPLVMTDPSGMIGDYYTRDMNYIGSDGIDDGKHYYAEIDYLETRSEGPNIIHVKNSEEFFLPSNENQTIGALAAGISGGVDNGISGIFKGIGNAPAAGLNGITGTLLNHGIGSLYFQGSNPLAVPLPFSSGNASEKSYMSAGTTGTLLGLGPAAGVFAKGGAPLSVVPEVTPAASSLPLQTHHFATIRNKTYTPQMADIASEFGLNLKGSWNTQTLPHLGRHTNKYHEFVLDGMSRARVGANGSQAEFLRLFNQNVKQPVIQNPNLLGKKGW
ncbi:MAG TPA: RHS repeat-associated core domain-containing protein [Pyrinomonadaceae bacterium]|nr:RHS repeat-associated core domain-containing protein [Pyrinomonadaceae bacterium]